MSVPSLSPTFSTISIQLSFNILTTFALDSACNRSNNSTVHEELYGDRNAGIIGGSHFFGGYAVSKFPFVVIRSELIVLRRTGSAS